VASRAEPVAPELSPAPSIRSAVGGAARDFYYHSWRLLPANILWSVVALVILIAAIIAPAGILLLPVLALPTSGIFRITTRIARGGSVSFWDAIDAWRTTVGQTLALGAGIVGAAVVLATNLVLGLAGSSPLGWAVATLAGWGLVVLWLFAWTAWPIVVDPARADRPVVDRIRLAALLVLAHPIRIGGLGLVLGAILVAGAVAVVGIVSIAVSFAALVASRYVLPAADRLDTRLNGHEPAGSAPIADTP
jgi:hypothetical protein